MQRENIGPMFAVQDLDRDRETIALFDTREAADAFAANDYRSVTIDTIDAPRASSLGACSECGSHGGHIIGCSRMDFDGAYTRDAA